MKLVGGREVTGVLRGFDTLVNLVLDDCVESLRDPQGWFGQRRRWWEPSPPPSLSVAADPYKLTGETRALGLVVARGTSVMLVMPSEGRSEVDNPWQAPEEPII